MSIRLTIVPAALVFFYGATFHSAVAEQQHSLPQAHAHNDYEHKRPLLDALDHRFCSVEADIWLADDSSLLVGHDLIDLRPECTLTKLYLEPLLKRCRANRGWIHEPGQSLILLIDIKSDGEVIYPVLSAELKKYKELFVSNADTPPAVHAILSGNRPTELVAADKNRLCGIDGRLSDIPCKASSLLVPLISDNFKNHFRWRGKGPMSAEEKTKLRDYVKAVHTEGRLLRFWATPDTPDVWTELQEAGVDLIGTDDLGALENFLSVSESSYSIPVTVTSELPYSNVPLDLPIDFPSIIREANHPGVLDPNSIVVFNPSTGQVVPHALSQHFRNSNKGHVRWIAEQPSDKNFEIHFQTTNLRSLLKPAQFTPMIGVGDLLRYNAGDPRPVSVFYVCRMADLTGDGQKDIIGCEAYTSEPNWPVERVPKGWGNLVCLPVIESGEELLVGDAIRLRYREPGSSEMHLFDAGYLHGDVADINRDDLPDLIYSTHKKSSYASRIKGVSEFLNVFLNTGELDEVGMPIFELSPDRIPHPTGQWAPVRTVDLNSDGSLDFVLGTMFSGTNTSATFLKNTNPNCWPIQTTEAVKLQTGNNASFLDLDHDGHLDSICLVPNEEGERTSFSYRVAWRRNLGSDLPEFGDPEILTDIDLPLPLLTTSDREDNEILVCGDYGANLAYYKQEPNEHNAAPRFKQQIVKSISAPIRVGDQATPFPCDWDHDGDWDLLVGGGYGKVRILINQGDNLRPAFDAPKPVFSEGKPIEIYMSNIFPNLTGYYHDLGYVHPCFLDWDADGLPDLLLPNLSNRIFWYKNIGSLKQPLFGSRQQIVCDGYPETTNTLQATAELLGSKTKEWTKRIPDDKSPFWWRSRAGFGDFNGDGLTDLVTADAESPLSPNRFAMHSRLFFQYRDSEGKLRLRKGPAIEFPDGTKMLNSSGTAAQLLAVDWDRDQLLDLVINTGETNSTCPTLIRNIGTKTDPKFDFPVPLSCFGEKLTSIAKHGPYYGVGDLDQDGRIDLLACPEAGTYLFFRGTALSMNAPPNFRIGSLKNLTPDHAR